MDGLSTIFLALADPSRRALMEQLQKGEATVTELAAPHTISVLFISRHLNVLEPAGLITETSSARWRRAGHSGEKPLPPMQKKIQGPARPVPVDVT